MARPLLPILNFACHFRYPSGFQLATQFRATGRVTALVAPSGHGKTTVLALIAGLLRPDKGKIELGERVFVDTERNYIQPPEKRRVGYLFQEQCLFPHLTVRENIAFGAKRNRTPTSLLKSIIQFHELENLLSRLPNELSGGQQQRVALARALACSPEILLLDEPLTAVEDELRARVAEQIIRTATAFSVPIIMVSHQRSWVEQIADQVISLDECSVEA